MAQTNQTQSLDPQVVSLAQAIRQTESGGNFQAKGASGEYGAYQWMPSTWKSQAQEFLGDSNAQMTPSNQNAVAYSRIKQLKDQGYNPAQIAAIWNSGSPDNWENKIGTNKYGVQYNVPAYVKSVTDNYQQFKSQNMAQQGQNIDNPVVPTAEASTGEQPQDNRNFLQKASDFVGSIFPGQKIGQDIGTLAGYIYSKAHDALTGSNYAQNYDLSAPSPLQAVGDAAQGALMVGTGLPEGEGVSLFGKTIPTLPKLGAAGEIAKNAAIGAGFGATGAIANGSTNLGDIGKQTAFGASLGGAAGIAGEALSSLADRVPKRIINNLLPQLKNPETIDYAIDNLKLGSTDSMLNASNAAKQGYYEAIQGLLKDPELAGIKLSGSDLYNSVIQQFPRSEMTEQEFYNTLKRLVPNDSALVTSLSKGGINLQDVNELRSAIGDNVYKTKIDAPEIKAGKDIGNAAYKSLKEFITQKAGQTAPIFDNYSKEINLNKALKKLVQKQQKKGAIGLKELLTALGAQQFLGPVGGIATLGLEKAAEAPITRVGVAKGITALRPAIKNAATVGKVVGRIAGKTPISK